MNIDKKEIKAIALACDPTKCSDEAEEDRRLAEFYSELTPETALALLAEIEHTEVRLHEVSILCATVEQERDRLKAENEALRKQVADLSPFKNAPPQDYRASNKCLACGEYHHGLGNLPCPRFTPVAQSAMAKEPSHG
ncbi:hypothetical protein [Pseudomonas putida]|uniref:hypothetical protein n=1 Tax=Pseudomonas putida TaxID=303 RepID=UPI000309D592|nr:hypothetical protein [Pseudomonas putida]ANC80977.1 hypothetical protein KKK_08105 [Pseudomonas putida B6-2]